jgi:hypothetical protein
MSEWMSDWSQAVETKRQGQDLIGYGYDMIGYDDEHTYYSLSPRRGMLTGR